MTPSILSPDLETAEVHAAVGVDAGARTSLAPFLALAGTALMIALLVAFLAALLLPGGAHAEAPVTGKVAWAELAEDAPLDCGALRLRDTDHCEIREFTTALREGHFAVEGMTNGSVIVTGAEGSEVRIVARVVSRSGGMRGDPRRDAARLATEALAGRFQVSSPRRSLFGGGSSGSVSVDLALEVPREAALSLRTTNGAIRVTGVQGALDARSTNGLVEVAEAGGSLEIRTTNGGVRASLLHGPAAGERVSLTATNGSVDLVLPENVGARLEARTSNGGIRSDFGLAYEGARRNQASGVIGSGGGEITLRTTNGPIRIARRP